MKVQYNTCLQILKERIQTRGGEVGNSVEYTYKDIKELRPGELNERPTLEREM